MWFDMRRETLAFARQAPVVHVSEAQVAAPRAQVFASFAEPACWKHWFPNVRDASYTSPPPYGVGTIRESHVGNTYWVEEMIAWDEGTRWAWTVTRASVPFAHAQVESFEFTDAEGATRVRWTLALEPRLLARLGAPFAPRVVSRLFGRAMRNLSAYVAE
jgi:carbon monoxide dehydrogenase subunit G